MSGPSPGRLAYAPGRVNLIGDHTDYNDGLALPMAIDLGVEVGYAPGSGGTLVIRTDLDSARAEISTSSGASVGPLPPWARLAAAVVEQVGVVRGGRAEVRSDLPAGAGLSSSAAFGVALSLALGAEPMPIEVARLCQRAERTIGVPVGLMDPLVSMAATAGHALLIDFATLATEPVALPDDVEVVIVDSGTSRSLDASPYATRRSECEAAAAALGGPLGRATPGDLDRISDPLLRRRATHVVSEVARVRAFVEALSNGDLLIAGSLMVESHRSLSDDFDVSTPALDRLVTALGKTPGVLGARLTGAGFGGCVVVLCRPGTELSLPNRLWRVRPSAGAWVRTR
ncbi:MAG TPA: galactokinase family protein [Acidimicrobiales bacterium]|nr:galactokinase family protein [Acidimicrobiales bacterium]